VDPGGQRDNARKLVTFLALSFSYDSAKRDTSVRGSVRVSTALRGSVRVRITG